MHELEENVRTWDDVILMEERELNWEKGNVKAEEEYVKRYLELPHETENGDLNAARFEAIRVETGLALQPVDFLFEL